MQEMFALFHKKKNKIYWIKTDFLQFKMDDMVYLINPLILQLCTTPFTFHIFYIGPLILFKIIGKYQGLLMDLSGCLLTELCNYKNLKIAYNRIDKGPVPSLRNLKQMINCGLKFWI